MAQLNITLNQEEILSLLQENSGDAFKKLLQESLNAVLKAESKEQLKAEPYERSEERTDSRNGFRERLLTTRIGTISLTVPRHRNEPFKSMIFDNYSRSEAALIAAMTEMVVNGVSTRRVALVVEQLCGKSISKSSVSELCKDLDKAVGEFKNRPLSSGEKVDILYNTMLDRPADENGKAYWVSQLDAGVSEAAIINGFCGSEEFGAICAGYGIEPGSVDVPKPDQPDHGVDYWVEQMRGGLKPQDVAKQFIFSEEATNKGRSNDEFIRTLYRLYMGREADDGGLAYWNDKMAEGMTYEQVNDGFAGSEEFAAIVAGFGL